VEIALTPIRLGVIGISDGNGHPYSWSAIINGFDPVVMRGCPFPVIVEYLSKHEFPAERIHEAQVTHIWTQDRRISEHISSACLIEHVVDQPTDLIGHVDGVLLARDDYQHHYELSEPFLRAGLPVYIDKPLAVSTFECDRIFQMELHSGQIFSCTALRYAREFEVSDADRADIGNIRYLDACVMKTWDKYAVHVVEPALKILGDQGGLGRIVCANWSDRHIVTATWESGVQATFAALGSSACPIRIRLFGDRGFREYTFADSFSAFRQALLAFVGMVKSRRAPIDRVFTRKVVEIIELGNNRG